MRSVELCVAVDAKRCEAMLAADAIDSAQISIFRH